MEEELFYLRHFTHTPSTSRNYRFYCCFWLVSVFAFSRFLLHTRIQSKRSDEPKFLSMSHEIGNLTLLSLVFKFYNLVIIVVLPSSILPEVLHVQWAPSCKNIQNDVTKVLSSKQSWGSIHGLCASLVKPESTVSLRNTMEFTVLTCLKPFCLLHRLDFLHASSERWQTLQVLLTLKNGNMFFLSQCMRTGSLALIGTKRETHYATESFLPSWLADYY